MLDQSENGLLDLYLSYTIYFRRDVVLLVDDVEKSRELWLVPAASEGMQEGKELDGTTECRPIEKRWHGTYHWK